MQKLLIATAIMLSLCLGMSIYNNVGLEKAYKTAQANVKAYSNQLSDQESEERTLQLTISQLQYFKDSILQKMDSVRKVLNIKDKSLKSLSYIESKASKQDTIILNDTIFREARAKDNLLLDTIIGDAWYQSRIKLQYPNYIVLYPAFKSQKYITVSTKKETINPPKKWWVLRLFQKKHEVVIVDVVEENPYIQDSTSKFVEIIK